MSRFYLVIQLLHFQFDSHSNASWGMIISIASCQELAASYHQRSQKLGVTQLAAKLLHLSDENWIYAEELGFMISPFLLFFDVLHGSCSCFFLVLQGVELFGIRKKAAFDESPASLLLLSVLFQVALFRVSQPQKWTRKQQEKIRRFYACTMKLVSQCCAQATIAIARASAFSWLNLDKNQAPFLKRADAGGRTGNCDLGSQNLHHQIKLRSPCRPLPPIFNAPKCDKTLLNCWRRPAGYDRESCNLHPSQCSNFDVIPLCADGAGLVLWFCPFRGRFT